MPRPRLILTRPAAQSLEFADAITAALPETFDILISPLQRIDLLEGAQNPGSIETAIFTSAHGIRAVRELGLAAGCRAFCVGEKTARIAADAGYDATAGPGDAEGLVQMILKSEAGEPMVHFRGQYSRGEIARHLSEAGKICEEVVCYQQVEQDLTPQAQAALAADIPVVLPVFSPRTAALLTRRPPPAAPTSLILMSDAVAQEIAWPASISRHVADAPTAEGMIGAIASQIPSTKSG